MLLSLGKPDINDLIRRVITRMTTVPEIFAKLKRKTGK